MEYTNENFEAFQRQLAEVTSSDSLLWELRDAIFCEAFYGKQNRRTRLYSLPCGEYPYLLVEWLRAFVKAIRRPVPRHQHGKAHFLFCSSRNNHINRIYPLFKETSLHQESIAWVSDAGVFQHIDDTDRSRFIDISNLWARHIRIGDVVTAIRYCRNLKVQLREVFNREDLRKTKVYFILFFAWRRFWRNALDADIDAVYCTFEKHPAVKSFFYTAKEKGVKKRVHWIHGLRHASIQATLSTELWCMTPGDVRFFESRVPEYCTPKVMRNPETDMLVSSVGMRTPDDRDQSQPVHFLFLGPGLESSYAAEMRNSDLAIIEQAQKELGDKVSWRFRPHPSAVQRFREELEAAGIDASDFSSNTLIDDLQWADAVGSSWSSLLLDVRETGRPIFWVQSEVRTLGGVDELIEDGIGHHASKESFADLITKEFNLKAGK